MLAPSHNDRKFAEKSHPINQHVVVLLLTEIECLGDNRYYDKSPVVGNDLQSSVVPLARAALLAILVELTTSAGSWLTWLTWPTHSLVG